MLSLFMKHFMNPKNVGEIKNADCVERLELQEHNLKAIFFAKKTEKGIKVKYKVIGCSIAIVMCSYLTELLKTVAPEEILQLDFESVYSNFAGESNEEQRECGHEIFKLFKSVLSKCLEGGK